MPTVHRPKSGKWKITMYFGDHDPPHFHIVFPDGEAVVDIETLTVFTGSAPAKILKAALKWAAANGDQLRATWRELHR